MSTPWRAATRSETESRDPAGDQPYGAFAPNLAQRLLINAARKSFLHRGLFRKTVCDLAFALGGGKPIDTTFRGCAYRLHGSNNLIDYGILLNPAYNAEDIEFLLDDAPGDANFVDIGCNVGLYSLPLANAVRQHGRTLSIDANPLMASRIAWNAAASNLDNVTVVACAVSDVDGRGDLIIRKGDISIAAIEEKPDGAIAVRTLASVLAEAGISAIHGLKIDIEGHEDKALVPFLLAAKDEALPKRIVIEHPQNEGDYAGCVAAFAKRGYALAGRTRNNSLYLLN